MAKGQHVSVYLNTEVLDYLKDVSRYNDQSLSKSINKVLSYAVKEHRTAKSGDQTSIDLFQLLGSKPGKAPNGNSNS